MLDEKDKKIAELQRALDEATETLEAIRTGAVDAIVVQGEKNLQVFTLKGADHSYRVLVESMNEGALILEEKGSILYANAGFSELIKLPLEQIIGDEFSHYLEGKTQKSFQNLWNIGLEDEARGEFYLKGGGESLIPTHLSLNAFEADGQKRICLVVTDLTEQKMTEKIIEHGAELRKTNDELVRINQIRTEFTSIVSHELRTPLVAVRAGITMLLDELDGPVTAEQRETLTVTKDNIDRLDHFIQNVLSLASIEAGKIELKFVLQELNQVIEEVVKLMRYPAQKKQIELVLKMPPQTVSLSFDHNAVRQILINLIHNAIKFTLKGGKIRVELLEQGADVLIHVQDSGIGIRKKDKAKIFGMFEQAEQNDFNNKGGSGIGLAVCQKLIQAHGGTIQVKSEPNQGSLFIVCLSKKGKPKMVFRPDSEYPLQVEPRS